VTHDPKIKEWVEQENSINPDRNNDISIVV